MSDLISRSETIQRLIQETIDSKNNLIHINTVKRLLQDVDTAYDVNNVVTELAKSAKESHGNVGMGGEMVINIDDAIEIVKSGSVIETDICEWKSVGANDNWSTSCYPNAIHNVFGVAWFEKCPYCGRKLKIVGDNDDN